MEGKQQKLQLPTLQLSLSTSLVVQLSLANRASFSGLDSLEPVHSRFSLVSVLAVACVARCEAGLRLSTQMGPAWSTHGSPKSDNADSDKNLRQPAPPAATPFSECRSVRNCDIEAEEVHMRDQQSGNTRKRDAFSCMRRAALQKPVSHVCNMTAHCSTAAHCRYSSYLRKQAVSEEDKAETRHHDLLVGPTKLFTPRV